MMTNFRRLVLEAESKKVFPDGSICIKDGDLTVYYNKEHQLHRVGGPAIKDKDTESWYINGKRHRVGGPAHTNKAYGLQFWQQHDKFHRTDGPAYINNNVSEYFINGKHLSKEEFRKHFEIKNEAISLASKVSALPGGIIRRESDYEIEYSNRKGLHREDGPAYINKITQEQTWYLNGKLHRTDGPAHIMPEFGVKMWYVNGKQMSKEEFEKHFDIKNEAEEKRPKKKVKVTVLPGGVRRREDSNVVTYKKNKQLHRVDGPAFTDKRTGEEMWCIDGRLHRTDGPAYLYCGDYTYWVRGRRMSKEEFEKHFDIKNESRTSEEDWEFIGYGTDPLVGRRKEYELPNGDVKHVYLSTGMIEYFNKFGQLHRIDGPARTHRSGFPEYFVNGNRMDKFEFEKHFVDD